MGNAKFPNMRALADSVHARGLKFGIYSSPGPRTCGGYAGSHGREAADTRTFTAWRLDYLKGDWCSTGDTYRDEDMRAIYQVMGTALAETRRPIVYSFCQYGLADVASWGASVGASQWRSTFNIQNSWAAVRANFVAHRPFVAGARANAWPDPDMLEIGNGRLTPSEARAHFTMWAIVSAPLILGNHIRRMDHDTSAILSNRDVIAINQDSSAPAVLTDRGASNEIELRHRRLSNGSAVLAAFNLGDEPADWMPPEQYLGSSGNGIKPAAIRDLWTGKEISTDPDARVHIAPHSVAVVLTGPSN